MFTCSRLSPEIKFLRPLTSDFLLSAVIVRNLFKQGNVSRTQLQWVYETTWQKGVEAAFIQDDIDF
ncbi:hypothetical protein P5673_002767 [Acropora cervicornis]|uniref:Uncharacterized protein n=1 Tax=Acropora cervicornis TaxID=6130 RepID=A0AAD9R3K3_ACRCE|nr:hypothetical protein P5673_002767 [Acropora cervicornis]